MTFDVAKRAWHNALLQAAVPERANHANTNSIAPPSGRCIRLIELAR